jgi:hypothetical protein
MIFKKNDINIFEYAKAEEWLPNLEPTRLSVPDWWKNGFLWNGSKPEISNYSSNKGMKACVPFLDSMLSGYTIKLWTDCMVELDNGIKKINWMNSPDPVESRSETGYSTIPVPVGCDKEEFTWKLPYYFKTPKNYSFILTHPFNRNELPFISLTGLVDAESTMQPGRYPFFLKTGFTGLIPAGTPIAQIILIKREKWKIKENRDIIKEGDILGSKSASVISGYYKKNLHKPKSFE